jgi:hypothetical protein
MLHIGQIDTLAQRFDRDRTALWRKPVLDRHAFAVGEVVPVELGG